MSDETPQNDQDTNIANLRKAADEGAKAKAELEQARRELLFAKAGVDTDKGVGALLFKAYDGEMTVEAIQAQVSELGIAPAAAPGTPAVPPPAEPQVDVTQTLDREALANGSLPATIPDEDPYRSAMGAFEDAVRSGLDPEMAAGAAFQRVFGAAVAGDRRVLI